MTSRYSSPPCPDRLDESTRRLRTSLDTLEPNVRHLPLPAPSTKVPLTDEQRDACMRELEAFYLRGRFLDYESAIAAYRQEARGRMRAGGRR
jgi:hypothetical protein